MEFDLQQAMEQFRVESQTERLAMQKYISDGFDKLANKFDEHADQDRQMFAAISTKMTEMDLFKTWVTRISIGISSVVGTTLAGWVVTKYLM